MSDKILRKYGAATTIDFSLYAVDGTVLKNDAVFAAGDVKIMKDEGESANITTLPSIPTNGLGYKLLLTAAEMTTSRIVITIVDQTSPQVWLDKTIEIETYGNPAAQHPFDLASPTSSADLAVAIENANKEEYLAVSHCVGANNQKLFVWSSLDGKSFRLLNGGISFDVADGYGIRDPAIFRHTDGKWYVAFNHSSYYLNSGNTTDSFGILVSDDKVTWTLLKYVPCNMSSVKVWGPKWFVDSDGSVHVFVTVDQWIYETHPLTADLSGDWSALAIIIGTGFPSSGKITGNVPIKIGSNYFLWIKDDSNPFYIGYASSPGLTGPYTVIKPASWSSPDWAGWGQMGALCLIHLGGSKWRLYMQTQSETIYWSESNDNWVTWTAKTLLVDDQSGLQPAHISIIRPSIVEDIKYSIPTTEETILNSVDAVPAAILAKTGITVGGTWTIAKLFKVLAAWAMGNARDKTGTSGSVQEILDPDDGTTVIAEVQLSKTTPYRQVTIKI